MTPEALTGAAASQRIDKWLWCARFFRTRAAAADYVESQTVRLTREGRAQRVAKPGFALKAGDELALLLSERPVIVRVRALAQRRGSALDAAALFDRIVGP